MYKTSTDYGRLWELIKPTSVDQRSSGILCRARYGDNNQHLSPWFSCPTGGNFVGESEAFSAHCEKARIEFIDPASQQNPKTFSVIADMSIEDAMKHIPGGARINTEECFVESLSFDCNGESMHEHWGEGVTPAAAVLKLYKRAKRAECGIEKTSAELAAGEMADVLQWALDAMPPSLLDYYYCKELVKKAEEILKKARGE